MNPYHVGKIFPSKYLFLKKMDSSLFQWFKLNHAFDKEEETSCVGKTAAEAIHAAYKLWKADHFSLVHCGFRYTLPERDQVGCKALFWEMVKSYTAFNGRFFHEEIGHLCYVDFASQEALSIWRKIR